MLVPQISENRLRAKAVEFITFPVDDDVTGRVVVYLWGLPNHTVDTKSTRCDVIVTSLSSRNVINSTASWELFENCHKTVSYRNVSDICQFLTLFWNSWDQHPLGVPLFLPICYVIRSACTFLLFSVHQPAAFDPFGGSTSTSGFAASRNMNTAFAANDSFSKFDPFAAFGSSSHNNSVSFLFDSLF